jgi:hypothetical protein
MHLTGAAIFFSWFECCTGALAQIDKEKGNVAVSQDRERKREALHISKDMVKCVSLLMDPQGRAIAM